MKTKTVVLCGMLKPGMDMLADVVDDGSTDNPVMLTGEHLSVRLRSDSKVQQADAGTCLRAEQVDGLWYVDDYVWTLPKIQARPVRSISE